MGRGLRAVNQHRNFMFMGQRNHLFHRIHRSEHIADMAESSHDGARTEQRAVLLQVEHSSLVNVHHAQLDSCARLQQLPGNDIGMMLHHRQYHLVAFRKAAAV